MLGYTSQARFLINCGLADLLQAQPDNAAGLAARSMAAKLINEHEMGELFKVLAVAPPACCTGCRRRIAPTVIPWKWMSNAVSLRKTRCITKLV